MRCVATIPDRQWWRILHWNTRPEDLQADMVPHSGFIRSLGSRDGAIVFALPDWVIAMTTLDLRVIQRLLTCGVLAHLQRYEPERFDTARFYAVQQDQFGQWVIIRELFQDPPIRKPRRNAIHRGPQTENT